MKNDVQKLMEDCNGFSSNFWYYFLLQLGLKKKHKWSNTQISVYAGELESVTIEIQNNFGHQNTDCSNIHSVLKKYLSKWEKASIWENHLELHYRDPNPTEPFSWSNHIIINVELSENHFQCFLDFVDAMKKPTLLPLCLRCLYDYCEITEKYYGDIAEICLSSGEEL
jgi:hypothetical protein